METIIVRPGDAEIKGGLVALWDQDQAHAEAVPGWADEGGAFIAGDPGNPDAVYTVALTGAVQEAIQKGRLVVVNVDSTAPEAVEQPSADTGGEQSPADEQPPAETPKKGRTK